MNEAERCILRAAGVNDSIRNDVEAKGGLL